jgi:hypothetical protein
MFTISSLKEMTSAKNITNDIRKTEESFKKIDAFFEFISQLIREQLQNFGTPINFKKSLIDESLKNYLLFIDLAVLHTNEMQNDEGVKKFTFEVISNAYKKIIQLMNLCQPGDCLFTELWGGISSYVTLDTHYPISVLACTLHFKNIKYMALLNELCIEKYLMLTAKDSNTNINLWKKVIETLTVPELELNEYISICKNHGLFLTLYTYGLQELEKINDDYISNMSVSPGYSINSYKNIFNLLKDMYDWILAFNSSDKEFSEDKIILMFSLFADIITMYPEISQYTDIGRFLTKMIEELMNWIEPRNKILLNLGFAKKIRYSKNFQFYLRSFLIYLANTIQFFPNFKQITDGSKKKEYTVNLTSMDYLLDEENIGTPSYNENISPLSPKNDIFYWNCEKYLNSLKIFPIDNINSDSNDKNYIGWLEDTIDSILALQPDSPLRILFRNTSSFAEQLRIKLFPSVKKYYHI